MLVIPLKDCDKFCNWRWHNVSSRCGPKDGLKAFVSCQNIWLFYPNLLLDRLMGFWHSIFGYEPVEIIIGAAQKYYRDGETDENVEVISGVRFGML